MTDYDVNQTGPGENTRLQRWADPAMFVAEPIGRKGPQVYLISATPDPLGEIASAAEMYVGNVVRDKSEVLHNQRKAILGEMQKTKIKAPLEFVQFHFLIEGVTRAFTHQLVRQRTATYVQESMRFAVKEDVPVGLPPSLTGTTGVWRQHEAQVLADISDGGNTSIDSGDPEVQRAVADLMIRESEAERQRWSWDLVQERIASGYQYLVNSGMPAEDARGLLPTNVLTRIHYSTDLRALLDHAGNRLCTQAQFEWRIVFSRMARAIRQYDPYATVRKSMYNVGHEELSVLEWVAENDRWQWEAIADLLKPICYQTGKCEFMSSMDRACVIRDRVQANYAANRPSSEWGRPLAYADGESGTGHKIDEIYPAEWLLNPGAAR